MPSIPRILHQSWHSTDYLKWPAEPQVWRTSWSTQPGWEMRLHGDEECLAFMKAAFPKLVDVYQALPSNAERADLFRYCILHEEGGVWADLDTTCMEPLSTWPINDVSLLVGMHAVCSSAQERGWLGLVRPAEVCQWIIGAAPKHPVLAAVIRAVESRVRAELKSGAPLATTAEAVFNRTGVGVWTDTVLASLTLPDPAARWEDILAEPFEQGETRILPMRAFGWDKHVRRLRKSQAWDRILVRHHAMGSWRPKGEEKP